MKKTTNQTNEETIRELNNERDFGYTLEKSANLRGVSVGKLRKHLRERGIIWNSYTLKYEQALETFLPERAGLQAGPISKEKLQQLATLMEDIDTLQSMIELFKQNTTVLDNVVTIDLPSAKLKPLSVRVNEAVLDRFETFCEANNAHKKGDLIAMALIAYMDKFENR